MSELFYSMAEEIRIHISDSVIESLISFAKNVHPKEFSCLLEGKWASSELFITGLVYQHFVSSSSESILFDSRPLISNVIGSAHSHPSNNNSPSSADRHSWSKEGGVHIIICAPYKKSNVAVYDSHSRRLEFSE